jgi:hypothetical protein
MRIIITCHSELPVIMVVGIVAAWLVVLVGVSVFVCCRRRLYILFHF